MPSGTGFSAPCVTIWVFWLYSYKVKTFIIIFPPSNTTINGDLVRERFENHQRITDDAWGIAGDYYTSADVYSALGVGDDYNGDDVVLVLALGSDYSGYYYADLWNKFKAWSADSP